MRGLKAFINIKHYCTSKVAFYDTQNLKREFNKETDYLAKRKWNVSQDLIRKIKMLFSEIKKMKTGNLSC